MYFRLPALYSGAWKSRIKGHFSLAQPAFIEHIEVETLADALYVYWKKTHQQVEMILYPFFVVHIVHLYLLDSTYSWKRQMLFSEKNIKTCTNSSSSDQLLVDYTSTKKM